MSIVSMLRRNSGGTRRTTLRIGVAIALAAIAISAAVSFVRSARDERGCIENLRSVYDAVRRYDEKRASLPDLAFFPSDVRRDLDSLLVVLEPHGLREAQCVCPSADRVLAETGITYVWNVSLNGRSLSSLEIPVWMMVEINALSASVPATHRGGYHVLYSDGRVEREINPPAIL